MKGFVDICFPLERLFIIIFPGKGGVRECIFGHCGTIGCISFSLSLLVI